MTLCCIIMPKRNKSRQKQEKPAEESEEQEKPQQPKAESKLPFCLYDLLELARTATPEEIKKQYRKLVLQYHPDKNRQDPNACQKFQKLKEAYDILIDAEKRKEYDETGRVGQQFSEESFQSAYQYFRSLYKKVTPEDINAFEKQYREGQMEEQDLLKFYQEHEGNMVKLIESIPLSKNQDIPRFIAFFEKKIEEKIIPRHKAFDKTKKKVRLLKDQQEEWEDEQKQEKEKGLGALMIAIRGKNSGQKDFIASLEEKYGVGKKKKVEKQEKPKKEKH